MGNCKDCKYWFQSSCTAIVLNSHSDLLEQPKSKSVIVRKVIPIDSYQFRTGPDFGCVLFEQKESKQ